MIKISEFTDITYTITDQVAVITINRHVERCIYRGG